MVHPINIHNRKSRLGSSKDITKDNINKKIATTPKLSGSDAVKKRIVRIITPMAANSQNSWLVIFLSFIKSLHNANVNCLLTNFKNEILLWI